MGIRFFSVSPNPLEKCSICYDPLDKDVVAHDKELLYAMHKKCLKAWVERHPTCPHCRGDIDLSSLFSLKERVIIWSKNIEIPEVELRSWVAPLASFIGVQGAIGLLHLLSCNANPVSYAAITTALVVGTAAFRLAHIENTQAAMLAAGATTVIASGNFHCVWNDTF
jgi:hypothetical protein